MTHEESISGILDQFVPESVRDRSMWLVAPLVVLELGFFVTPLLYLIRISLYENSQQQLYVDGTWTLASYRSILTSSYVHDLLFYTFELAVTATVLTLIVGVLYSYAMWRAGGVLQAVLIGGIVFPFFVTLVVRVFAWYMLLAPGGTINDALVNFGMAGEPLELMNNNLGVVIGQLYINLPYAVLAIYGVLETMDWEVVEAAKDLGASRTRAFFEVIVPHMAPGIVVAAVISFAWSFGAYTAPKFLGSGAQQTIAIEVEYLLMRQFNWAAASALAVVGMVVIVGVLLVCSYLLGRWGGETTYV